MSTTELFEYSESHSTPEYDFLAELNRETNLTQVYPRMLAGHMQGMLLRFISHMLKPRRVLEIGTFTGYSGINFSLGLAPDGVLHTIDVDPELEETIRKYIKKAKLGKKIILHIGEALQIIPTLRETWDLVYIDADKPNYLNYYKSVIDKVRPGGVILADNALWDGKVLETNPRSTETKGIQEFNEFVMMDARVENLLLPFRDGVMIIWKKS